MISAYLLLDDLAPVGAVTEAYTWLVSAAAAIGLTVAMLGRTHREPNSNPQDCL